MNTMIAYCGIVCSECPTFIATREDDDAKRAKVAEMWSKQYKMAIKAEDINCDGCISAGGQLFSYCSVCDIRKCGQNHGVVNCAYCTDYGCERLTRFFKVAPHAKKSLEKIRKKK